MPSLTLQESKVSVTDPLISYRNKTLLKIIDYASIFVITFLPDFSSKIFTVGFTSCADLRPYKSKRKAMNRNWSNQKANPALKTKTGNK